MQKNMIQVAHFVPQTRAEGPGLRTAIWLQGCSIRCPGCCNPEMFSKTGGQAWKPDALANKLAEQQTEGISFLGGEPFDQAPALKALLDSLDSRLSVMIYSGYRLEELTPYPEILEHTDLLVDGRYEQDQPEQHRRWIGSCNQRMHFLSNRYHPDDPCFTEANTVEITLAGGTLEVVGWPDAAKALS